MGVFWVQCNGIQTCTFLSSFSQLYKTRRRHFEGNDINKTVEKFISRNELIFLSSDETRFNKRKHTNISIFREQVENFDFHNQTRKTSPAKVTVVEKLLMLKNPSMQQHDLIVHHDDMEGNMEGNVAITEEMVTEDMEDKEDKNVVVMDDMFVIKDKEDNDVCQGQSKRKTGTTSHINEVLTENIEDMEDKDDSPQSCKRKTATLHIDDGNTEDNNEYLQMHKRKTATLHIDEGTVDNMEDRVVSLQKSKRKRVSTLHIDAKNAEVMLDYNKDVSPRKSLSPWKSKKKLATLRIDERRKHGR